MVGCEPRAGRGAVRIDIVDGQNGWPVPGVELKTTHHVRLVSDNAGVIACDLPELMGVETWLHVEGHGYGVPADGFGYRGVRLTPTPGGRASVKVHRELPGKRLAASPAPGSLPRVKSSATTRVARARGAGVRHRVRNPLRRALFWLWGDTTLAKDPLGIFHTLGATTSLKPLQSLSPHCVCVTATHTDAHRAPRVSRRSKGMDRLG